MDENTGHPNTMPERHQVTYRALRLRKPGGGYGHVTKVLDDFWQNKPPHRRASTHHTTATLTHRLPAGITESRHWFNHIMI